jgi:hypothetical protein
VVRCNDITGENQASASDAALAAGNRMVAYSDACSLSVGRNAAENALFAAKNSREMTVRRRSMDETALFRRCGLA